MGLDQVRIHGTEALTPGPSQNLLSGGGIGSRMSGPENVGIT